MTGDEIANDDDTIEAEVTPVLLPLALPAAPPPERNPVLVYLTSLSESSRRTTRQALERIARMVMRDADFDVLWFDWPSLRFQHTSAIRAMLAEELAPATANRCIAALRGVLQAAWRLELMSSEDFHRAADVQSIHGERLLSGRRLSLGEMTAFFEHCASDRARSAFLDAALFAVMVGGGLRREEVVQLELSHLDIDERKLRVLGKGNKERMVPLERNPTAALSNWLNVVRGLEDGPLSCPVRKGGRLEFRAMSAQAV